VVEAARRKERYRAAPWHRAEQLRGAFLGGEFVGGFLIEERVLRIGGKRLTTGCVGAVMVRPEHRGKGFSRHLVADVDAFARENRLALLLLAGIDGFYAKHGYADVFDPTEHSVLRGTVESLPTSPYRVRDAVPEDAEALLDLYRRHFHPFDGSFERTIEEQRWRLDRYGAWRVAVDAAGELRGAIAPLYGSWSYKLGEASADDWPAALALLHDHAAMVPDAAALLWPAHPASTTAWLLVEHLPIESRTKSTPDGDWMAKPGHLPTLLAATGLPEGVEPKMLVQCLFGYRPAPPELARLFRHGRTWITGSDSF
jgi:GNAT superfamily N-acetyltransferase